jgi:hypothetical protein
LTVAHGGIAGAVVELLVVLTVAAIFLAVWLRERQAGRKQPSGDPARLRDDD